MIVIVGTIRIPVENLEAARPAMRTMLEATRQEEGCVLYSFAEDVLTPGTITIAEIWRDRDCLTAHAKSEHMKAWRTVGATLGITDRDLKLFNADDGMAL